MEAESEEGGFHERGGKSRLDDVVVLSRKHKEVAYNADMMRERVEEEAGAGAAQPCLIHSHLLIMAEQGQWQPDGQRLQLGKKKQGSRDQTQTLHGNHHSHDS